MIDRFGNWWLRLSCAVFGHADADPYILGGTGVRAHQCRRCGRFAWVGTWIRTWG